MFYLVKHHNNYYIWKDHYHGMALCTEQITNNSPYPHMTGFSKEMMERVLCTSKNGMQVKSSSSREFIKSVAMYKHKSKKHLKAMAVLEML